MSKFEDEVIKSLSESEDNKVIAARAYKRAVNEVNKQIGLLKYQRDNLIVSIDEKNDELKSVTFNPNFNLEWYDNVKKQVDDLKEQLEEREASLNDRTALLKTWE